MKKGHSATRKGCPFPQCKSREEFKCLFQIYVYKKQKHVVAYPIKYLCGFAPLFPSLHELFPHTFLSSVFIRLSFPAMPTCEEAGKMLWEEHQCPQTPSSAMCSACFNHPPLLFILSALWGAPVLLSVLGELI